MPKEALGKDDILDKKIRKMISQHIKEEPETGWAECVSLLTFSLKSLIHDSSASEEVKKIIIEKMCNVISQEKS